jgi:acyl carrier protein
MLLRVRSRTICSKQSTLLPDGCTVSEVEAMLSFSEYCERLLEELGIGASHALRPEIGLYDELGLDSLQAFELVLITEQLVELYLPPADMPEIFTLGDAYSYYRYVRQLAKDRDDS